MYWEIAVSSSANKEFNVWIILGWLFMTLSPWRGARVAPILVGTQEHKDVAVSISKKGQVPRKYRVGFPPYSTIALCRCVDRI